MSCPLTLTLGGTIVVSSPPEPLAQAVMQTLSFTNPKWVENDRMGRWNKNTPKTLKYYERTRSGKLILPRGFIREMIELCRRHGIDFEIDDRRRILDPVDFAFSGDLHPFQQQAADRMLTKEFGTLQAPTGSGKTVIALHIIARRRQPALVMVHTKDLAAQWISRIEQFLGIPEAEIGVVGMGKQKIGEKITVGMVQSLYKQVTTVSPAVGHLVVDECHRAPARTFTEAVSGFDGRYMLGLTATPFRRDKLTPLIGWYVGRVLHRIQSEGLVKKGFLLSVDVVWRPTAFQSFFDPVTEYPRMLSQLTADDDRNRLIVDDIAAEAAEGNVCLVLTDRRKHCDALQALLKYRHGVAAEKMTGELSAVRRKEVTERVNAGAVPVLIATGQLIGEGFDCKALASLFITTPVKFDGRLIQYLGRVLRPGPGKTRAKVYDYVDEAVGPLAAAARSRQRVYCRDLEECPALPIGKQTED